MGNFQKESTGEPSVFALNQLKASQGDVVKVVGINLQSGMFVRIGGKVVPLSIASSTAASFVMPETISEGDAGAAFFTRDNVPVGTIALVEGNSSQLPIMEVDSAVICSDITYRDALGHLRSGTRNCASGAAFCEGDGQTSCVTNNAFPSVSRAALIAQSQRIRSGTSIAGVSGTLDDCSIDGANGCVVIGPTFSAALLIGADTKIIAGQTLAGVTGASPQGSPPCTGANQTGCLATSTFRTMDLSTAGASSALNAATFPSLLRSAGNFEFWDSLGTKHVAAGDSDLIAANIRSGVTFENLSITGTMPTNLPLPPTSVASSFNNSPDRVVLNWTNMGMSGYLVVARIGTAPTFVPTRNIAYTAGAQGVDTIVYAGSGTTFTHTPVTAGATYYYKVYSYDTNLYYSSTSTGNTNYTSLCSGLAGGTWVAVPGDSDYNTQDFCVMKYEASNATGIPNSRPLFTPWTLINQPNSRAACQSLGSNYDLISNHEWLTIAGNITSTPGNWSSGTVGTGSLNIGHSDNDPYNACAASNDDNLAFVQNDCTPLGPASQDPLQKRTHVLNNGNVIWDLAGNVSEWTTLIISDNNHKPYRSSDPGPGAGDLEFNTVNADFTALPFSEIAPNNALKPYWNDAWVSAVNGVGIYNPSSNGSNGYTRRGDAWGDSYRSGVYNLKIDKDANAAEPYIGFRCVYHPL
ncbi:MAG: hypothetical protein EOP07_03700 [Proteobacteria bacterium]|nr:MAG: hypothetical protein EOP07_03700 [Pseudomonadota bacterium]